MSKRYKVIISVIAILCSALACGIGYGLSGSLEMAFSQRFLCNFVFMLQFLATAWCVIAMFKKS